MVKYIKSLGVDNMENNNVQGMNAKNEAEVYRLGEFEEVELTKGMVKVALVYIGEGICGEYNEEDPEDIPLMRFDVYKSDEFLSDWQEVGDASYCTQLSLNATEEEKKNCLQVIMDEVYGPLMADCSIKKICERLSWIDEKGNFLKQ
jgi:hypothetical protein